MGRLQDEGVAGAMENKGTNFSMGMSHFIFCRFGCISCSVPIENYTINFLLKVEVESCCQTCMLNCFEEMCCPLMLPNQPNI